MPKEITAVNRDAESCASEFAVSCASLVYLGAQHTDADKVWANSFPQFLMFAAGIVLAILTHGERLTLTTADRASLVVAAVCSWLLACRFCHLAPPDFASSGINLVTGYLLIAAGCAGVIVAALDAGPFPSWMLYLGRISYGLYVFHLLGAEIMRGLLQRLHPPMMETLIYTSGLALTVCIAAVSYRFFEQPFLRWKEALAVIHTAPTNLPSHVGMPECGPIGAHGPTPDVSHA